jgi:hypothetical protein
MIQLSLKVYSDMPLCIYKIEAVKQYILISNITMTEMLCHLLVIQGKACWPCFEIIF